MMKLATLDALGYTSTLELLAERFHVRPTLLQQINQGTPLAPGQSITVPNVEPFHPPAERKAPKPQLEGAAGLVTVSEMNKTVRVETSDGKIVFQAPVSIGSIQDPLPKGEWTITGTAVLPVFQYNPSLFWDADPGHAKAKIAPGPNNPVGVIWIDLSREHLGFHGTPEPSRIGKTQSHGCLRLTNWDAHATRRARGKRRAGRPAMKRLRLHRRRPRDEVLAPWVAGAVILGGWGLAAQLHWAGAAIGDRERVRARRSWRRALTTRRRRRANPRRLAGPRVTTRTRAADLAALRERNLIVPVAGVGRAALVPSFSDDRGGRRAHEALDVLAPRGTPVVATDGGTIVKLFTERARRDDDLPVRSHRIVLLLLRAPRCLRAGAGRGRRGRAAERPSATSGRPGTRRPARRTCTLRSSGSDPERQWWEGVPIDPYVVLR